MTGAAGRSDIFRHDFAILLVRLCGGRMRYAPTVCGEKQNVTTPSRSESPGK